MIGPTHLLHGRNVCPDTICHDQSIHFMAHMEELDSAVNSLLAGDDFDFSFDLTEEDRQYLGGRLKSILGPDFLLDFH
jgi:hypothetical protein